MLRLAQGLLILSGIGFAATLLAGNWSTLSNDGLHDPSNPSLRLLQDPAQALSLLAPDTAGNKVDWVAAVQLGQIRPRTSVDGSRVPEQHDSEIIMANTNTIVSNDVSNWLIVCCNVCDTLSRSFVTRLSSSPRGCRSKYDKGIRLSLSSTSFRIRRSVFCTTPVNR